MAEVILPGEEENNVPVVPEIVLETPGINSKVIEVSFDALNTRETTIVNTSQMFFTTDTDAWIAFTLTGLTDATGTYSLVLRNRGDGSTFQRVGNMVDGKAYYKLPEQEIRHAGRWIGQMYVTLENGQTTAAQFSFRVDGHILDGKDVRETVVEDFQTLMAQLQGVKGQAEIDLADLKADLSLSTVEAEQLIADTQELKLIYDELLETGVLQTNINEKLTELETTYAPKLTTLEQNDVSLTAQLQQTATKEEALTSSGYIPIDFHPLADNPVLTRNDITDRTTQGVADPFIVFDKESGLYHMFFEIISEREEIGHAYSVNGFDWTYTQVVLSEGTQHFAYPLVFKYENEWYMIPDKGNRVDVYKANNFPYEWENIKTLINRSTSDATIWQWHDENWYMHVKEGSNVNLYYTDHWLEGSWKLHPMSPIITPRDDFKGPRGAGKAIVYDNLILLPIQGYFTSYGQFTKWFTISELSTTTVSIAEGEIFQTGDGKQGWNLRGMHHLDHVQNGDLNLLVADSIGDASIPNHT